MISAGTPVSASARARVSAWARQKRKPAATRTGSMKRAR